ncbi:hypothetical protein IGI04_039728 [Brassica rapa subsp. trilocularis]|uniref:GRF-type domain-containing protein n=1 Tax=Brassica rapa subsp. trilocularis TaxID=1813537 RepID=A0ABQ7KME7_BRACM|nr:hypothetical protein IGI04_039728 [Brassica rapa subsp. trilocularis]
MDPRNPYSQSAGYIGLLHSQHEKGVKAAKAKRSNAMGKSVGEYKEVWEMRKVDLDRKEKLSKLAILDTLLAKTEPLSEREEVSLNMGPDYSYSQPSQSEEHREYVNAQEFVYPPQPEVEFGFPQTCYCGSQPQIATSYSTTDPGRRYYTCTNVDDGECHVWKWWDEAVMEEMRARDRQTLQLAEKVDSLNFLSDYETDQKLVRLENMVSSSSLSNVLWFSLWFSSELGLVMNYV